MPTAKNTRSLRRIPLDDPRITNPFYVGIMRHGYILDVPIKSQPHGDRSPSNPYYARIRSAGGIHIEPAKLGRPRRGEDARPTVVKSVRLTPDLWESAWRYAQRKGVSVNSTLQRALVAWLQADTP